MQKKYLLFLLLTGFIVACQNQQMTNAGVDTAQVPASTERDTALRSLFNKEWHFQEVNNRPVVLDSQSRKEAFIILEERGNTAVGELGCNAFGTTFILSDRSNEIKFFPIRATQNACSNRKMEQQFLGALAQTEKYEVSSGLLVLKDAQNHTVAKLRPFYHSRT
ncbi:META domain-containing protein [Sphingobacterium suaedae]|uniref:META domain-containing protein n=1 Tax=Sphingobacterium suaedae TaxID=1686402 RepID=A0ABW5KPU1_9SPHI